MISVTDANALIAAEPSGIVTIADTVRIGDRDNWFLAGKEVQLLADPAIVIDGRHWTVTGGRLKAMNGVLFDCLRSTCGLILNVWASGALKGKELFRCVDNGSCYDTNVIGGEWSKPQSMTTPIVRVDVGGPTYNRNTWQGLRFQTNGLPASPVVRLRCANVANWIYGNTFRDINFEIPNAGAIHLESCFQTTMDGMHIYDADMYGPITDDVIRVGKFSTGLKSKDTRLSTYARLSGALAAGKVDIRISDEGHYAENVIVEQVGGIDGAGLTVALPSWVTQRCVRAQYV